MSADVRNYVRKGEPQYLTVAYDAEGNIIGSMGPYATRGPAMAQRRDWPRAALVRVEVATPTYEPIAGTEIGRLAAPAELALLASLERRSS